MCVCGGRWVCEKQVPRYCSHFPIWHTHSKIVFIENIFRLHCGTEFVFLLPFQNLLNRSLAYCIILNGYLFISFLFLLNKIQ